MIFKDAQTAERSFLSRLTILAYSAAILGAQVTDQQLREAQTGNWLHYNGSYDSRRHSSLNQINTGTVDSVVPKWCSTSQARLTSRPCPLSWMA